MTTQSLERPAASTGRPWWVFPTMAIALLVLGLLAYGLLVRDRAQLVNAQVPDLTLQTFDGQEIALRDLGGRPAVINFWASWCRECDKEMRLLQESHEKYGDEILFLGVDYVDTEAKALAYLSQYGITYPNGPDLGGRFSNDFNIKGVPETFFIGADGTIQGFHMGPLTEPDLEQWIAQLRGDS